MKALEAADKVILYSIDGEYVDPGKEVENRREVPANYPVLGKLELEQSGARADVIGALASGLNNNEPAKCFEPRLSPCAQSRRNRC